MSNIRFVHPIRGVGAASTQSIPITWQTIVQDGSMYYQDPDTGNVYDLAGNQIQSGAPAGVTTAADVVISNASIIPGISNGMLLVAAIAAYFIFFRK